MFYGTAGPVFTVRNDRRVALFAHALGGVVYARSTFAASGTDVQYEMVPIPGGKFKLGSPAAEKGRKPDEGPQVAVEIVCVAVAVRPLRVAVAVASSVYGPAAGSPFRKVVCAPLDGDRENFVAPAGLADTTHEVIGYD